MVVTRAAVDRCGLGHVATPLSPTGTEEGQVRGGGERVALHGHQPVHFSLYEEEPGGERPASLAEPPGPQEQVQRHTVEHIVDFVRFAPLVQILCEPVEQLPDIMRFFDTLMLDPEQVIDVPKILPEDVPLRAVLRDTQLAEQLVEVPTILSFSLLQRMRVQSVDIPVPGGGGRFAGLQGFLPGQGSTAPQFPEERFSERIVEQIVDIRCGSLQGFRPGQSSSASSSSPAGVHENADEPGVGFFSHFSPLEKKCGVRNPPESEGARQCQLIHAGSSAPLLLLGHGHHQRRALQL